MFHPLNYSAHAIEDLKRDLPLWESGGTPLEAEKIKSIIEQLTLAEKFILPHGGFIFDRNTEKLKLNQFENIKLPFNNIALEFAYTCSEACQHKHKMIILCYQINEMISITYVVKAGDQDWAVPDVIFRINTKKLVFSIYPIGEKGKGYFDFLENDKEHTNNLNPGQFLLKQNKIYLEILLQFLQVLSCSNIKMETLAVPAKLNKKREAKGKQPFFEYKILTVAADRPQSSNKDHQGGTHASPRQHLRRGHIRRLTDRKIWINSCVVGSAETGIIKKDYAVKAAA